MAHFAQLDDNNIVINVITVGDDCCLDDNGNECEEVGINYCKSLVGEDTRWVQTSRSSRIRGQYAGIGRYYHEQYDVFVDPKPYESWSFDPTLLTWIPPIPLPTDELEDDMYYKWNEEQKDWETGLLSEDFGVLPPEPEEISLPLPPAPEETPE